MRRCFLSFLAFAAALSGCAAGSPEIADWCAVPQVGGPAPVTEHEGGIIYEIYVRSFLDTDGDGVGDLQGVIEKLDYLDSVGASTLWLMPVFESPSVAGYNPADFDAIEADYGTRADFDALVEAARARGMRVILDVAINHTADTHPWFERALDDPEAGFRYLLSEHQWDELRWFPTGDGRYYYAFFGADHPDLNWTQPAVAGELRDALTTWLDAGVGGYRVDAVVQLIEEDGDVANTDGSHCAMAWLFAELKASDPGALVLSEAWHKAVAGNLAWLGTEDAPEADLVIDVPRRYATIDAFGAEDASGLAQVIDQHLSRGATSRVASYLSSHDLPRLPTVLSDAAARRAWMVFHLLGYGQPMLYYGDELDLPDSDEGAEHDYAQRGPMPWDDTYNAGFTPGVPWYPVDQRYLDGLNVEAQGEDPDSMLSLVRALVALRQASVAVRVGETSRLDTGAASVLALLQRSEDEAVLVLVNVSSQPVSSLSLRLPAELGPWVDLTGGALSQGTDGVTVEALGGRGYRVIATEGLAGYPIPAPLGG